jgi:hypothetical protein
VKARQLDKTEDDDLNRRGCVSTRLAPVENAVSQGERTAADALTTVVAWIAIRWRPIGQGVSARMAR